MAGLARINVPQYGKLLASSRHSLVKSVAVKDSRAKKGLSD